MEKTKKFFKDIFFYSGSNIFSNALNFITGIVVRRLLQPALMGLFNEIMLLFDYAKYSHLGIIDALDKELPYFYGMKNYKKVEALKDIGFTICLGLASFMSFGLFVWSFFMKFSNDKMFINGARIVMLMIFLNLLNALYIVLNRSRNRFSIISKYTIIIAVLDIITKVFLVIKFKLYGLLWASVLTWMLGLIYFYKASDEKFKLIFNFPFAELSRLFKIGFPIFIMGFVYMTLKNIDRIMIIRLLNRESLGFYTIALMVSVYVIQLPNLIYAVIFPRFYQAYGEKQNIFEIKEIFIKPTMVFAYFFPILIGFIILILPLLIWYILPNYLPGLLPACLLLLGSFFLSIVNMPGYLLIVLNRQIYMILIGAISIFVGAVLNYLFIRRLNLGLPGVAIGTSIAYFFYSTVLIVFAFKNYTSRFYSHIKLLAQLYLPFLWVWILLLILQSFVFISSGNIFKDFYITFYKSLIFLFCCIPLMLYANKKTSILSLLKRTYLQKMVKC